MRKTERARVAKNLHAMSTYSWRRTKANELMTFGDVEPANLYNETVLCKAKQMDIDKNLGLLDKVSDPVASILALKYKLEFSGIIREIGLDKFFVIYFSPEQLFLYKQFNRTEKTGTLSINATGSLVKKIMKSGESTHFVFLYQIIASFKGKIIPVLHSEKHHRNILTYCYGNGYDVMQAAQRSLQITCLLFSML